MPCVTSASCEPSARGRPRGATGVIPPGRHPRPERYPLKYLRTPGASSPRLASSAPRDGAVSERLHVRADVARSRQPDAVPMFQDVLEGPAQPADPIRTTDDERMQRDRSHERLARRLREHLVELVDDHVGELVCGVA